MIELSSPCMGYYTPCIHSCSMRACSHVSCINACASSYTVCKELAEGRVSESGTTDVKLPTED